MPCFFPESGKKVYGCEGPPSSDSEDGLDDDAVLNDVTYAPLDTAQIFLGKSLVLVELDCRIHQNLDLAI